MVTPKGRSYIYRLCSWLRLHDSCYSLGSLASRNVRRSPRPSDGIWNPPPDPPFCDAEERLWINNKRKEKKRKKSKYAAESFFLHCWSLFFCKLIVCERRKGFILFIYNSKMIVLIIIINEPWWRWTWRQFFRGTYVEWLTRGALVTFCF